MIRSNLQYPVVVEKKIPVISKIIEKLLLVFMVAAAVMYFLHLPVFSARTEMETVAVLTIYPRTLGLIFGISILGFLVFYFLNVKIRAAVKGFLHFEEAAIMVETGKEIITIPVIDIADLKFYDPGSFYSSWMMRNKFYIFIFRKLTKPVRIRLVHYEHADEVVDSFLTYDFSNPPREAYSSMDGDEPL